MTTMTAPKTLTVRELRVGMVLCDGRVVTAIEPHERLAQRTITFDGVGKSVRADFSPVLVRVEDYEF